MKELDHRFLLKQRFALINPLQVDKSLWEDLPLEPLVPDELSEQSALMPGLLALSELTDKKRIDLLYRVQQQAKTSSCPYFSALIESSVDKEKIATRLTQHLLIQESGSHKKALFRYYDPKVFAHLHWILDEKQLALLMLGIDSWHWRDTQGNWHAYQNDTAIRYAQLRINTTQWQQLAELGRLNGCLEHLAQQDAISSVQLHQTNAIQALLHQAAQAGLTDKTDQNLFVEQALRFTPRIHQHRFLQSAIIAAANDEQSYVGSCSKLDDAHYALLLKEINEPKGKTA